jgi:hypothetical protein
MTTFFIDKHGQEWSKANIEELIDAVRMLRKITQITEHYRFKLE